MFDAPHATLIMANGLCSDSDNILLHPMELDVLYIMFIFIISGKLLKRLSCEWLRCGEVYYLHVCVAL